MNGASVLVPVLLAALTCTFFLYYVSTRQEVDLASVVDERLEQVVNRFRTEMMQEVERRGRAQADAWAKQAEGREQSALGQRAKERHDDEERRRKEEERNQAQHDELRQDLIKEKEHNQAHHDELRKMLQDIEKRLSDSMGTVKAVAQSTGPPVKPKNDRFTPEGIPYPSTLPPLKAVPNNKLDEVLAKRAHSFTVMTTDKEGQTVVHQGKDVILIVFNKGYVDLLRNLLCTLKKNNMTNVAGIALDDEALAECSQLGIDCVIPAADFLRAGSAHFHYHGTADFQSLSKLKSRNVLEVVLRGYNVFLIDGDIVFFRDPLAYLRNGSIYYDLQIQSDSPYGASKNAYLNSGCYYIVANPRTHMFLDVLWAYGSTNAVNVSEQTAFAHLDWRIQQGKVPGMSLTRVNLELREFCNGANYFLPNPPNGTYQPRPDASSECYLLHFNWIFGGNKLKTMKANKFWFVDDKDPAICHVPSDLHS